MSQETLNLAEILALQARRLGDKPFLLFEDRSIGFAALNRSVNRVANGIRRLGAGPETGVAIMMANSPEWLFVYFATQKLNAWAVPVNTALKAESLTHVVDHSDARLLVIDDTCFDEYERIRATLPKLEHVIVNRTLEHPLSDGALALDDVMDASDEDPGVTIRQGLISAIMYTSGTTGLPKGVVSRYNPIAVGDSVGLGAALGEGDVMYTCLPLFHANALMLTTLRALSTGTTMALSRRFSASRFWDEIRRYQVTTFNALGAMIPILLKQPLRDNDADNPVKVVFSAACPADVWETFEQRFDVHIVEGYAAVDGGGFVVINAGDAPKGSIGKPSSPFRIVDDNGNDVPVGESGELIFKVDDVRRRRVEYYKNEAAGNARIVDGWFHTGDLLHADAQGNLYFDDRKTDSLRRRGENISAWEVERAINKHPAVLESAVFGVPSDLGEDDVMAVVQLKSDVSLTASELVRHCEEHLAGFMVPRYIEFIDTLPKTGTHRTQKRLLKQQGVGPRTWDRQGS